MRFIDFCMAWKAADPGEFGAKRPTADEMDERLHAERVNADRSKRSHPAQLADLPDGAFVTVPSEGPNAWLVRGGQLLKWSPGGYGERRPRPAQLGVALLTPPSTVAAIRAGYLPAIHASATVKA